MADAEAEGEAAATQRVQRRQSPPRREGVTRIDVGDGATDGEPFAVRQQEAGERDGFEAARFRVPQRAVAMALDGAQQGAQSGCVQPVGRVP
jgi:hypothetical protein